MTNFDLQKIMLQHNTPRVLNVWKCECGNELYRKDTVDTTKTLVLCKC